MENNSGMWGKEWPEQDFLSNCLQDVKKPPICGRVYARGAENACVHMCVVDVCGSTKAHTGVEPGVCVCV